MSISDTNLNATLAIGEEEEIVLHIPRYLVHLELELLLCLHLSDRLQDEQLKKD